MKKGIKKIIQLGFMIFILASCSNNGDQQGQSAANKMDTVIIKAMTFHPDTLTVKKGDTVIWINQDIVAHDVSHFPDRSWHSDTLQPKDSFQKVIEDSVGYFCSIHPTMKGVVLVK